METALTRTQLLFGEAAIRKLQGSKVAVFGIGGVGGHCVEALARSGVGALELIDNDTVSLTNLNRQIVATVRTIGRMKTEVAEERIRAINPDCIVTCRECFYLPETAASFRFEDYDYVVDAIDTVTAKLDLVMRCRAAGVPIISSMGTGNKLDPTKFVVTDIFKTSMDPLARVMRRELKKRGIDCLKVVYSTEEARRPIEEEVARMYDGNVPEACSGGPRRRDIPGSTAFVPAAAGLIMAGEVIKDLTGVR